MGRGAEITKTQCSSFDSVSYKNGGGNVQWRGRCLPPLRLFGGLVWRSGLNASHTFRRDRVQRASVATNETHMTGSRRRCELESGGKSSPGNV